MKLFSFTLILQSLEQSAYELTDHFNRHIIINTLARICSQHAVIQVEMYDTFRYYFQNKFSNVAES